LLTKTVSALLFIRLVGPPLTRLTIRDVDSLGLLLKGRLYTDQPCAQIARHEVDRDIQFDDNNMKEIWNENLGTLRIELVAVAAMAD